ncbi:hypothetical protein G7Y89_g7318 [Cudoniella acicularis]|uniref:Uncharacterized protein n=1 Tax=Cudoniella acicularis TaxID=354080 RepID=A0A8H4RL24_9HELO|nr:hypothetical protein G7Y89_g7318 [Cudoniella acicularis]
MIAGITEQITTDTKIHQEFSASKSSAALATTTAAPSPSVDEFEGLEDEPPTETTSAPPEEETLDPPVYTEADLIKPQPLCDSIFEWLTFNLAEQEKLDITSDPVLLTKDLEAKTKGLQDLQVELIMKSMKQPSKSKRSTAKTKKASKPKKMKSKSTFSKTDVAEKAEKTLDFDVDEQGVLIFKVGRDGKLPSEEEILAFIEKNKAERAAEDDSAGKEDKKHKKDEL